MKRHQSGVLFWLSQLDVEGFSGGVGGAELQCLRLAQSLIRRGFNVHIVAGRQRWQLLKGDSVAVDSSKIPVLWLASPAVNLLGSFIYIGLFSAYLLMKSMQLSAVYVAAINRVAAVVILVSKLMGKRVVCSTVGGDAKLLFRYKKQISTQMHLWAIQRADGIVAQGVENENILLSLGIKRKKVFLIPTSVDVTHFHPYSGNRRELRSRLNLPQNGKLICCTNRLHPIKRTDVVLRALELLMSEYPDLHLVLVGDGEEREMLYELANTLRIQKKVTFVGHVSDSLEYLHAIDIFVLASDEENHSNALIEALACGLPSIASAVGGNKDTIQHLVNGLLFPAGSHIELANCIAILCKDDKLSDFLGANARQIALEKYSSEKMVDEYIKLYELN